MGTCGDKEREKRLVRVITNRCATITSLRQIVIESQNKFKNSSGWTIILTDLDQMADRNNKLKAQATSLRPKQDDEYNAIIFTNQLYDEELSGFFTKLRELGMIKEGGSIQIGLQNEQPRAYEAKNEIQCNGFLYKEENKIKFFYYLEFLLRIY